MSRENLALIRAGYDAVNRRDFDYAKSLSADDLEMEAAVTNQTYRGREAMRHLFDDLFEAFGEVQMVIEEMIDVDAGDQVVVVFRIEAVGRGSGVPLTQPAAQVWTLRDGKAARCKGYLDRAAALESVGLS